MKYKLILLEKVEFRHEVVIETDFEIEGMCDYLQDEINEKENIGEVMLTLRHDKQISKMIKVLNHSEDEDGFGAEWEIEEYEVVSEVQG